MAGVPTPKINPELKKLFDPLSGDQLARLLGKIEKEGPREAIIVAEDGDLLDGHNRFQIYQQNKTKKYPIAVIPGLKTLAQKKRWMIEHQLSRRNLTPQQWSMYAALRFEEVKEEMTLRQVGGAGDAAKKVAEELGSSQRSVERAGEFKEAVESLPESVQTAALLVPVSTTLAAAKNDKPLFCERCTRVGVVKKCPRCAELQAEVRKSKKKGGTKSPKKGSELVDWKGFEAALGVVVRLSDRIAQAYPAERKSMERSEYERLTAVLVKKAHAWKKKITGGGK